MIAPIALAALIATADPTPAPTFHVQAQTTDGKATVLPDDAHGKDLVLLVSFTQESGKRIKAWSDGLEARLGTRVSIVGVAVLDRVPGLLRGMIRRAIEKDAGPPQPGKPSLVTTSDGSALRAAAPDGDQNEPVVYVFGPDGKLATVVRADYSEPSEHRIESALP